MRSYKNFKNNMYYEVDNYEKSFDDFLPVNYLKVASGEGSRLKPGLFQNIPTHYNSYDVMWINKIKNK